MHRNLHDGPSDPENLVGHSPYSVPWAYSSYYAHEIAKFWKFSKTYYMPIDHKYSVEINLDTFGWVQIASAVLSFVLLAFCKCFGPRHGLRMEMIEIFSYQTNCATIWLTNTSEKTYYMPMVWLKFPTILKNVLYAHRTICPWNTVGILWGTFGILKFSIFSRLVRHSSENRVFPAHFFWAKYHSFSLQPLTKPWKNGNFQKLQKYPNYTGLYWPRFSGRYEPRALRCTN